MEIPRSVVRDSLKFVDILDKYGLKSLYAFNKSEKTRGVPIRFNPKNGRSVLTYKDGSVVSLDGDPKAPIDIFTSSLGGWERDQLKVGDILDKYGLKSLYAFNKSVKTRGVPIGKGPIDIFTSSLGGWERDQLEVGDILDKYGLKSLYAFNKSEKTRGVPIRFNPKNGRSVLTYKDGICCFLMETQGGADLKWEISLEGGELRFLQVLILKSNNFHGNIQPSFAVKFPFLCLRVLDLSHNGFSLYIGVTVLRDSDSVLVWPWEETGDLSRMKLIGPPNVQSWEGSQEDLEQIDLDDLEEIDLQWEMAMLTNLSYGESIKKDRQEVRWNFIPFKPDLTFMYEIVKSEIMDVITIATPSNSKKVKSNHESAGVKSNGDAVEPKNVRKNSFRPLVIEDWNFDDESEVEIIPKDKIVFSSTEKKKFVKSAREIVEKGNPQKKEYKEKGVIDCGCSRHMTRNKCYLTGYEDYDGGFVSFGDGKGRISVKGKIKTGTLDFDNVYFCKELKYNLFSVSQICDKKNNVLLLTLNVLSYLLTLSYLMKIKSC
ncbi:putative ribonuclease H-like domain-containing protein [Tanacetum coccineum]